MEKIFKKHTYCFIQSSTNFTHSSYNFFLLKKKHAVRNCFFFLSSYVKVVDSDSYYVSSSNEPIKMIHFNVLQFLQSDNGYFYRVRSKPCGIPRRGDDSNTILFCFFLNDKPSSRGNWSIHRIECDVFNFAKCDIT